MNNKFKFKSVSDITLGWEYQDKVTGFSGIASAKAQHLTGCDRVGLQPREFDAKAGKTADWAWFDIAMLEFVSKGIMEEDVTADDVTEMRKTGPGKDPCKW